jgi:hypothetical protein
MSSNMSTIQTLHTLVTVSTQQILKDKPESREFSGEFSGHFRGRAVVASKGTYWLQT